MTLRAIVEVQLERLRAKLAEQEIELQVSDEGLELLAEAGWDPEFGARPLKRAIQTLVGDPLASALLDGTLVSGDRARLEATEGALALVPDQPEGAAA